MNKRHKKIRDMRANNNNGAVVNMPTNTPVIAPPIENKPRLICIGIPHTGIIA
jgi:hypothetical protein